MTKQEVIEVGRSLVRGGMTVEKALTHVVTLYNSNGNRLLDPESKEEIRVQLKIKTGREAHLTEHIRDWVMSTKGIFSVTEAFKDLQSVTNVTNRNLYRVIMNRLCKEELVERVGSKDGQFRLKDKTINRINIMDAIAEPINILWPFQIEEYVNTYPGNIIVVAGTSNAGKTAFLLNFVNMNLEKYSIRYQSSEMGAVELKNRLSKFNTPIQLFHERVEWMERAGEWWDLIEPDGINIIDYMEIHEEHYKIGGWIKKIFDALKTGIAIIAIQKKPNSKVGVGGDVTKEKSRLYLTIDFNKICIEKAKNWADGRTNPNWLVRNFELEQGIHFVSETPWKKEERT